MRATDRFMVTGVQMNVPIGGDNVDAMLRQIDKTIALFPGTGMIVFSELAAHGPLLTHRPKGNKDWYEKFCLAAARYKIWIVPGSSYIERKGAIYNRAVVIDPNGKVIGTYDKMFPFSPFETGVAGGTDFLVFDVPHVGRFGLSICYDIWFPETTRTLTSLGAEVLLHPVLTGTTDRQAEIAIVQATAAMFQCYVVDVNGLDAGGIGRSLIADPTGRIVHESGQIPEIFPITLDIGLVRQARLGGANGLGQTLKSWRDRTCRFPGYDEKTNSGYLSSLGPLEPMAAPFANKSDSANDPR